MPIRSQIPGMQTISMSRGIRCSRTMAATLVGYCRCSTDAQDLTAQRQRLRELGVTEDRIYLDHELTGTNRARPGLDQGARSAPLLRGPLKSWSEKSHAQNE